MPSLQRATLIFQSPGHGWTESYYYNSAGDDLTPPLGAWFVIAGRRAALLGTGAFIKGIRLTLVVNSAGQVVKNRSILTKVRYTPNSQLANNDLAKPGVCALTTFYNADKSRHKLTYLRGIPDDIENSDGTYNPAGAGGWGNRFDVFGEGLRLPTPSISNVGWWGYVPSAKIPIMSYTVDPTTSVISMIFPTNTFAGIAMGTKLSVRFTGVNVHSVINGPQTITTLGPSSARLTKPLAAGPFGGVGDMTMYTRQSIVINQFIPPSISSRKIGAPLLVSVGRSPAHQRT